MITRLVREAAQADGFAKDSMAIAITGINDFIFINPLRSGEGLQNARVPLHTSSVAKSPIFAMGQRTYF
ncbi:MAG: hypothetical protein A3J74_08450 [Elusimicrobia bacterium RIFCSPHIGHO2_02_FULL_57_9]|nr:MAG: hypothetical protein A3J74_08450 [Elusimicrobia bacterium RIFCSPHIGHO2_02_FULL_57_9]